MLDNSTSAIADIAKLVSRIPCVSYLDDVQLSDGLLVGSINSAAVVACSDMGWLVPYVCSSPNVQLFLFQNFGHRFETGGFVDTITGSGVEHVVVYGHSDCKYAKFLAGSVQGRSTLDSLQPNVTEQQHQLYKNALESDSESLWEEVGQFNVLLELKAMLCEPSIARLAEEGRLKVHGWFYKAASKQLTIFDPHKQAFVEQRTRLKVQDSLVVKFVPDQSCVGED